MVNVGDEIEIRTNRTGMVPRHGRVEKILHEDPLRIEIRWDDEHVSTLQPAAGALQVVKTADG